MYEEPARGPVFLWAQKGASGKIAVYGILSPMKKAETLDGGSGSPTNCFDLGRIAKWCMEGTSRCGVQRKENAGAGHAG